MSGDAGSPLLGIAPAWIDQLTPCGGRLMQSLHITSFLWLRALDGPHDYPCQSFDWRFALDCRPRRRSMRRLAVLRRIRLIFGLSAKGERPCCHFAAVAADEIVERGVAV